MAPRTALSYNPLTLPNASTPLAAVVVDVNVVAVSSRALGFTMSCCPTSVSLPWFPLDFYNDLDASRLRTHYEGLAIRERLLAKFSRPSHAKLPYVPVLSFDASRRRTHAEGLIIRDRYIQLARKLASQKKSCQSIRLSVHARPGFTRSSGLLIRQRLIEGAKLLPSPRKQRRQKIVDDLLRVPNVLPLSNGHYLLEGFAGSGKSQLLKTYLRNAQSNKSFRFSVLATTRKNAKSWRDDVGCFARSSHRFVPRRVDLVIVDEALLHSQTRIKPLTSNAVVLYLCDRLQNPARPSWLPQHNPKYLWRSFRPMPSLIRRCYPKLRCLGGSTRLTCDVEQPLILGCYRDCNGPGSRLHNHYAAPSVHDITGLKNVDGLNYASLQGLTSPVHRLFVNQFVSCSPHLLFVCLTRGIPFVRLSPKPFQQHVSPFYLPRFEDDSYLTLRSATLAV